MMEPEPDVSDRPGSSAWRLREPRWLIVLAILCLGGPLNPAVWAIGLYEPNDAAFRVEDRLFHILMIPSTIMTLVAVCLIPRRRLTLGGLLGPVMIGYGIAVVLSPLSFSLGSAIFAGDISLGMVLQMTLFFGVMGWGFLIIPYFAVTHGLPCAFVLAALIALCSKREDAKASTADLMP